MNLTILPELRDLIPPQQPDERKRLTESLKSEGCLDALVVWDRGTDTVLLDGHNRLEICGKEGIDYRTTVLDGTQEWDIDQARLWIIDHQLGRRNLTDGWSRELIEKEEAIVRARARENLRQSEGPVSKGLSLNDKGLEPVNTQQYVAERLGWSTGKVAQADVVRKNAPEIWEKVKTGEESVGGAYKEFQQVKREIKEQKREARREENRQKVAQVETPADVIKADARFATILIDPPWDWSDEGDVDQMGRAKPDYATMGIDQLMDLPVPDLADIDCHIYLWITNRSLPKGFGLLERWGFRYITAITWVKPSFGMGNYFRGQTEHILFGVKGSQPLCRRDAPTVFNAPRGKNGHSSKPGEVYDFVESCSPGPYLEMFSRHNRDGWVSWGEGS